MIIHVHSDSRGHHCFSRSESIIYPVSMPHLADKRQSQRVFKLQTKRAQGLVPPSPKLCTNAMDIVFQPVGILIGTPVGLGIAWTDSGWSDGRAVGR